VFSSIIVAIIISKTWEEAMTARALLVIALVAGPFAAVAQPAGSADKGVYFSRHLAAQDAGGNRVQSRASQAGGRLRHRQRDQGAARPRDEPLSNVRPEPFGYAIGHIRRGAPPASSSVTATSLPNGASRCAST
jgi:hypothetical protein